jgi:hypothetical protein
MSAANVTDARSTVTGATTAQRARTAPQRGRRGGPARAADQSLEHASVPRVALKWPSEVAAAAGVSDDFVRDQGWAASLPMVRVGSLRLVLVSTLVAFLQERESLPLDGMAER